MAVVDLVVRGRWRVLDAAWLNFLEGPNILGKVPRFNQSIPISTSRPKSNYSLAVQNHLNTKKNRLWKSLWHLCAEETSSVHVVLFLFTHVHWTRWGESKTSSFPLRWIFRSVLYNLLICMQLYELCSKNTRTVWIARLELVSRGSAWCR